MAAPQLHFTSVVLFASFTPSSSTTETHFWTTQHKKTCLLVRTAPPDQRRFSRMQPSAVWPPQNREKRKKHRGRQENPGEANSNRKHTINCCPASCWPMFSLWTISWTISGPQMDNRDTNIFCFTDRADPQYAGPSILSSEDFAMFHIDRPSYSGKTKKRGVCFFTNNNLCDSRNVSVLPCSCSPHLEHLIIIYRPLYVPQEFGSYHPRLTLYNKKTTSSTPTHHTCAS